jgi:polyisoprenoid-binding protein YceI
MALRDTLRRPRTWLVAVPVLVILAVVGGPFVYINFIKEDAPERLSFESVTTTTTAPADSTDTTAAAGSTDSTTDVAADGSIGGDWTVTDGSVAGYRVEEILFGQSAEAAGRTEGVTGTMAVAGTTIESAEFTVDLTTVVSNEERRDNQFHGRIMETATFPTATFTLSAPVQLDAVPPDLTEISVPVTGELTLHGMTQTVTVELLARRSGATIEVNGTIPITFSDYDIDNPSGGPAQVGDEGEIEFLLVFAQA